MMWCFPGRSKANVVVRDLVKIANKMGNKSSEEAKTDFRELLRQHYEPGNRNLRRVREVMVGVCSQDAGCDHYTNIGDVSFERKQEALEVIDALARGETALDKLDNNEESLTVSKESVIKDEVSVASTEGQPVLDQLRPAKARASALS